MIEPCPSAVDKRRTLIFMMVKISYDLNKEMVTRDNLSQREKDSLCHFVPR
jgi:hypothetical protein